MRNSNPWTWKDSELQAQCKDYKISLQEPFNRREAINKLKEYEAIKANKSYIEEEDGEVTYIDELKKKQPALELLKVIFHSTGEQDLPYVFIGHNGRGFYLPKEVEIEVPVYLLKSCIKDAVEERMMPKVDRDGTINWIKRKVQRHPYSLAD